MNGDESLLWTEALNNVNFNDISPSETESSAAHYHVKNIRSVTDAIVEVKPALSSLSSMQYFSRVACDEPEADETVM